MTSTGSIRRAVALVVVAAGLSLVPGTARAQATLTLPEALRRARVAAPAADLARAGVAVARGRTREETQWANPELLYRREDLNGNTPLDGDVFAEAAVPFPITGRRLALRSAGRAAVERAQGDSAALLAQLDAEVATAWWQLVRAEALAATARTQREALDGIAGYDSVRAREGAVPELLAIRARVEADRAAIVATTASAELARARATIAQLIGLAADAVQVAPADVAALTATPVPATPVAAVPRRPELAAAEAAEREQRRRVAAEGWAIVPDLTLTAGTKRTGPIRYTTLAVGLPIPLFHRNGGARERAQGELLAATAARRAVEARLAREAEAADATRRALRQAPPSTAMLTRAEEAAAIARAAYREGGMTQFELLEAQRAAAAAREAIVRWATELRLADVAWRRATGQSQETP
jgi:cobalt-zinc-cadmium efflux system outer membrane protein